MEVSSQQLLLNDSFSYAWLLNVKSSSSAAAAAEALGDSRRSFDTGSFIEIDPNLVVSLRWTTATPTADLHALDLDLPRRQSVADEILPRQEPAAAAAAPASNSALLRKSQSVNSNRYQVGGGGGASTTSSPLFHSAKSSPGSPAPPRSGLDSRFAMSSCDKSPKKLICKYFCFVMPLYRIVKNMRLLPSSPSSSSSFSSKSTASSSSTARSSPRSSDALSSVDWCRNNADISISDAILHCKNSIVACSTSPAAALLEEQRVTVADAKFIL